MSLQFEMSNVIPFPARIAAPEPELDIDLFTAVDVAIRDLRDLALRLRGDETGHEQARECLEMLSRALDNARAIG
mgnify:FL=1|jgi:hypothetical protein